MGKIWKDIEIQLIDIKIWQKEDRLKVILEQTEP